MHRGAAEECEVKQKNGPAKASVGSLVLRHMGTLWWDTVNLDRNVRRVCLASRSTVRVSGGLKSS